MQDNREIKVVAKIDSSNVVYEHSNYQGQGKVFKWTLNSDIDCNILIQEMKYLKLFVKPETISQYISYRYGLLPNTYSSNIFYKERFAETIVLKLLTKMRARGSSNCLVVSRRFSTNICMVPSGKLTSKGADVPTRDRSIFGSTKRKFSTKNLIPRNEDINYSGYLFSYKTIRGQQEEIFKTILSTKLVTQNYYDLNEELAESKVSAVPAKVFVKLFLSTMTDIDPNLLNFVFGTRLVEKVAKSFVLENVWDSKDYLVVPEVFKVIKSVGDFRKHLGKETVASKFSKDYKEEDRDKVCASIKGVTDIQALTQDYSEQMGSKKIVRKGLHVASIDPFMEKSLYNGIGTEEPLLYIKFGTQEHSKINFNDPKFKFVDYKESIKGSARETIVEELNAYPWEYWRDYNSKEEQRILESDLENKKFLAKDVVVHRHSLRQLSQEDEYSILLFRGAVAYSKNFIRESHSKPKFLEEELLTCAQIIVSSFLLKKYKIGEIHHKSPSKKIAFKLVKEVKPDWLRGTTRLGKTFIINWDLVKTYAGCVFPMWINTIDTKTLCSVAERHIYSEDDMKLKLSRELFLLSDEDDSTIENSTTMLFSENSLWSKNKNVTDPDFLRSKKVLESSLTTTKSSEVYSTRLKVVKELKIKEEQLAKMLFTLKSKLTKPGISNVRIKQIQKLGTSLQYLKQKCTDDIKSSKYRTAKERGRLLFATEAIVDELIRERIKLEMSTNSNLRDAFNMAITSHSSYLKNPNRDTESTLKDMYSKKFVNCTLQKLKYNCSFESILEVFSNRESGKIKTYLSLHNMRHTPQTYQPNLSKIINVDGPYLSNLISELATVFDILAFRIHPSGIENFDVFNNFMFEVSRYSDHKKFVNFDESCLIGIFKMKQSGVTAATVEHLKLTIEEYREYYEKWEINKKQRYAASVRYTRGQNNKAKADKIRRQEMEASWEKARAQP